MHDFGWQCSPVERAGTKAPPCRDATAAAASAKPEPKPVVQPITAPMPAAVLSPAPKPATRPRPITEAKPAATEPNRRAKPAAKAKPAGPQKLSAARGGKADNLQQISGIGPKLEKTLQGLGFFHFDQIAGWSKADVKWVDENLRFKGRIDREEWIPQAKLLAAGDMDKFAKKYGTGGLKGKSGATKSGTRTRRS